MEEKWIRGASLSAMALAVLTAASALMAESAHTRARLLAAQEASRWGHFQSKELSRHAVEMQQEMFQLEGLKGGSAEAQKFVEEKRQQLEEGLRRYGHEKNLIKIQAEEMAEQAGLLERKGSNFRAAVIFFQIALLFALAGSVLRRRDLALAGLLFGTVALIHFLNGVYLFR